MKFRIVDAFLLCIIISCSLLATVKASGRHATIVKHTKAADHDSTGFWKQQTIWKPRWVKYWEAKVVHTPLWKRVWGPVIQSEWVPLPNTPLNRNNEDSDRSQSMEEEWS